jgi:hypothetical protein
MTVPSDTSRVLRIARALSNASVETRLLLEFTGMFSGRGEIGEPFTADEERLSRGAGIGDRHR